MRVDIVNETGRRLPRRQLGVVARRAGRAFGLPKRTFVQLVFTSDVRIRKLNRRTRHEDRATDVLAFPLHAWSPPVVPTRTLRARTVCARDPDGVLRLGDIVVSVETAARQARDRRQTITAEVLTLVAHGLLHLLGHNHGRVRDEERMTVLTRYVLAMDGLSKKSTPAGADGRTVVTTRDLRAR